MGVEEKKNLVGVGGVSDREKVARICLDSQKLQEKQAEFFFWAWAELSEDLHVCTRCGNLVRGCT